VSEENLPKQPEETKETDASPLESLAEQSIEVTVNKATNELSLRDPLTGRLITFKANIVEPDEDEDEDESEPLTPEQFRAALQAVDDMGLTWTADSVPRVRAKSPETEDALLSDEYDEIQEKYPTLPRELSSVVFHALTGGRAHESIVGDKDTLENKAAAVRELIISPEYRAEFFFKHAIKVPYFESIDWEVVFKTHERNVNSSPAIPYALLMLTFHNTNPRIGQIDEHQNMTVAVNGSLVDKLMITLFDVRQALQDAQKLTDMVSERLKDKGDETGS
jgi:hypothetical protein